MSRGEWMRTRSGGRFYPADPRPEEVQILDIASGLARECRYGGQMRGFYTVAEHSILVAQVLPEELQLQGLLHDAPEAWLRDMVRPAKILLPQYSELEDRVWAAVAARFGLPLEPDPRVKQADDAVLLAEKAQLFPSERDDWSVKGEPANVHVFGFGHEMAERLFLEKFHTITKGIYQ